MTVGNLILKAVQGYPCDSTQREGRSQPKTWATDGGTQALSKKRMQEEWVQSAGLQQQCVGIRTMLCCVLCLEHVASAELSSKRDLTC